MVTGFFCPYFVTNQNSMNYLLLSIALFLLLAITVVLAISIARSRKVMDTLKESIGLKTAAESKLESKMLAEEPPNLKDRDLIDLKDRLLDLFEREKLYRNPDIRVGDIASRLYTNKNYLAQAIRLKTNKNFCQLVHSFRVREAMRLFEENPELSIRQLSTMVGFNSMTTFNSAFSRITGFTPAEWCREFKKKNQ